MHDCLRCNHTIQQLATRIASVGNDGAIRVRGGSVKGKHRDCVEHHIESGQPNGRLRRIAIYAALKLDPGHNRHQDRIVELCNFVGDVRVPVPQQYGDVRVEQVSQG